MTSALWVLPVSPHSEDPDRGWRRGPVRYLLTVEEDREYKNLPTSAGSYLVKIKVRDNHSREEVRTEASFEITEPTPLP